MAIIKVDDGEDRKRPDGNSVNRRRFSACPFPLQRIIQSDRSARMDERRFTAC